jgi:hypothetical protein
VIEFAFDLQQVNGFLRVLWFPPPKKSKMVISNRRRLGCLGEFFSEFPQVCDILGASQSSPVTDDHLGFLGWRKPEYPEKTIERRK